MVVDILVRGMLQAASTHERFVNVIPLLPTVALFVPFKVQFPCVVAIVVPADPPLLFSVILAETEL